MNKQSYNKLSLKELVTSNKIIIPAIQRDYIMGSKSEALNSIYDNIIEGLNTNEDMEFSTLLIHKANDNIYIYDGQQRVTTLFLLLAIASGKLSENIKISDYLGYTDNSRDDTLALLDNISLFGKINTKAIDTSTYSIIQGFEILKEKNMEGIIEYVMNKIKFNVVEKRELDDIDQYFIDLNDGVLLTTLQVFKAELTDSLLNKFSNTKEIKNWLYKIDNEYHYELIEKGFYKTSYEAYEENFIRLFYCIGVAYFLNHNSRLTEFKNLEMKDLDVAYDLARKINRYNDKKNESNSYFEFEDNVEILLKNDIKNQWEKGFNSVYKFLENCKIDFGLIAATLIECSEIGKAIANSFMVYDEKVYLYNNVIPIKSFYKNYYYTYKNENINNDAYIKYNNIIRLILKEYINRGNMIWEEEYLLNLLDNEEVKSLSENLNYNLQDIMHKLIKAAIKNKIVVNADLDAFYKLGEDFPMYLKNKKNNLFYLNEVIDMLYKYKLPILLVKGDVIFFSNGLPINSKFDAKTNIVFPNLRSIFEYKGTKIYSEKIYTILMLGNIVGENDILSGAAIYESYILRAKSRGSKYMTIRSSQGMNYELIELNSNSEKITIEDFEKHKTIIKLALLISNLDALIDETELLEEKNNLNFLKDNIYVDDCNDDEIKFVFSDFICGKLNEVIIRKISLT